MKYFNLSSVSTKNYYSYHQYQYFRFKSTKIEEKIAGGFEEVKAKASKLSDATKETVGRAADKAAEMKNKTVDAINDTIKGIKESTTTKAKEISADIKKKKENENDDGVNSDGTNIDPMGEVVKQEVKEVIKPADPQTEKMQKEGAKRKVEEDHFNLM